MTMFELSGFRDRTHTYGPPLDYEYRAWQLKAGSLYAKKTEESNGQPFNFLINAGVGSGKTDAAAGIGSFVLNRKIAERIVYVCPNRMIIDSVISTFKRFNIHLVDWENGKFPHGEPVDMDGVAMTYASLNNNIATQKRICRKPTALFLDENHHLGDSLAWCGAAMEAYEDRVRTILSFSGTPWRTDKRIILGSEFGEEREGRVLYKADCTYSLGEAIHDKVCRSPGFRFLDADVEIPVKGSKRVVSFKDELPEKLANRRLSGAVKHGTPSRTMALKTLIEESRSTDPSTFTKSAIFVGGDSSSLNESGKKDAQEYIPDELVSLGIPRDKVVFVTCDDNRAKHKIRDFGKSDAWILVTIDMVSEGVNIPELKNALFLSTVTSELKTIQRIGRVLRGEGFATIIMFSDPRYIKVHKEIEADIEYYEAMRFPDLSPTARGDGGRKQRRVIEPAGLKAWHDFVGLHGDRHSNEEFEAVRERLEAAGIPASTDRVLNFFELLDKGLINFEEALA